MYKNSIKLGTILGMKQVSKQKYSRIKKTINILLAVFFVITLTVTSASAGSRKLVKNSNPVNDGNSDISNRFNYRNLGNFNPMNYGNHGNFNSMNYGNSGNFNPINYRNPGNFNQMNYGNQGNFYPMNYGNPGNFNSMNYEFDELWRSGERIL